MQEINANIIKHKIISSNISISRNLASKFELSMNCSAKMKTPVAEEDRTVLLHIQLNISTKNDELSIELISDMIFELDRLPNDYNETAEQKLVPMARKSLLNSLDEMLVVMGYRKMELAQKM